MDSGKRRGGHPHYGGHNLMRPLAPQCSEVLSPLLERRDELSEGEREEWLTL